MPLIGDETSPSRDESVKIKYEWNIDRFLAYVSTWSGYVHYMEKHPGKDILDGLRSEYKRTNSSVAALNCSLARLINAGKLHDPNEALSIDFETFILLGRKTTD